MASCVWTASGFALAIPVLPDTYRYLFQTQGLAALAGCVIHGHVVLGSRCWKESLSRWADVWPSSQGTFSRGLACHTMGLLFGQPFRWSRGVL